MKGEDGSYRFATITSIVPQFVDTDWQNSMASAAGGDLYHDFAKNDALKKAVQTSIEAKYIYGPTDQRYVREIAVSNGVGQAGDGDEVKIRIMVCSPNHDQSNASNVASTDASWTEAETRADAAVATLRADPSKWSTLVADSKINDDVNWNSVGGDIPWIPSDIFNTTTEGGSHGLDMSNVATAVFAGNLKEGTILDPISVANQGWVVIQFQGRRPAPDQRIADAQFLINSGASAFATQARTMSQGADAMTGGELGWVSPYMLKANQQQAIDETPVGRMTPMVVSNGYFVYQVTQEQTRTPDPVQQVKLKSVVFLNWLDQLQASALIWEDNAAVQAAASASPGQ
jgi:hypothetical protein